MTITSELANLRGMIKFAAPLPWHWATSNSMARLSSASGKDGDVIRAFTAVDGVPCVNVSPDNMNLIASAVNALPELLAHIDAQAARIAELEAAAESEGDILIDVIADNRELKLRYEAAEKELAALRAQAEQQSSAVYQLWSPGIGEWIECDKKRYDDWMLPGQGRVLYTQPVPSAPVAVPNKLYPDNTLPEIDIAEISAWNSCIDEMLLLNSGSTPFVVKLPPVYCSTDRQELYQMGQVEGQRTYREFVIEAIRAAGGRVIYAD